MAQKLINTVEHCVDDSIRGLLSISPNLRLIENSRVVVRSDILQDRNSGKVAVICGGGSGHEPAFAGYVGRGFLSAAICGDVFTSPNSSQISTALNICHRKAGILVCVFNYTGDRLNFAIAVERFKSQKDTCPANTVFIADDCALTDMRDRSAGRRGLAGGILVLKMVSAAAESGKTLQEITHLAETAVSSLRTIGVSLSSCCLPGHGPIFELPEDEMELGLGVHGEAGVARMKTAVASEVIDRMLKHMTDPGSATSFALNEGENVVVLLNNLGGMSQIEMNILAKEALEWLAARKVKVRRCISGPMMTSLEMRGVSISVLKLVDAEWLEYLDSPVESLAWPASLWRQNYHASYTFTPDLVIPHAHSENSDISGIDIQGVPSVSKDGALLLDSAIRAACSALIEHEEELDNLDRQCGDGDCGATMKRGAEAILKALPSFDSVHPRILLQQIASTWQQSTGGTSGAIYSLFFLAAANSLTKNVGADAWLSALVNGTEAVMKHGGAKPGDRTMVDVLNVISDIARTVLESRKNLEKKTVKEMKEALRNSAEATTKMKARAGRASYVASTHLHSPDPGAVACFHWMTAILSAIESQL